MKEREFLIGDFRLKALESGERGQPLLLALHGWLDNAATFNELRKHFPHHHFIALDLAGHGLSDHRPTSMPYYIWDNVSDLLSVLDQLGVDKVTLIGHSMGASIAALFAGAFPDRIERLHLIEGLAPLVYEESELSLLMSDAIIKRRKMMEKLLRPYPDKEAAIQARMRGRWPVCRQAAEWLIERGLKRQNDGFVWRSDPGLMLPSILRMTEGHVTAFLKKINAPVSVYLGETGLFDESWRARIKHLQRSEVYWFNGNHHLHLEPVAARLIADAIKAAD